MKLSNKQLADIETARYFIPNVFRDVLITDEDIRQFLAVSERGEKNAGKFDMNPLLHGKRMREWHMRSWEETVLEGTIPYSDLLIGIPLSVVKYMKKSMFGGMDAKIIEKCYVEYAAPQQTEGNCKQ